MSGLAGVRVLVPRAEGQGEEAAALLREKGAVPVVIPAIEYGPPSDVEALRLALCPGSLAEVDWVVFTSATGVERVFAEGPAFGSARFAVVGPGTASALASHGVNDALSPEELRGEGLAKALLQAMTPDRRRVLILRAEEASDVLPDTLVAAGATVRIVPAYRTRASGTGTAAIKARLERREIDAILLSSGSMVNAICDALGVGAAETLEPAVLACIGPVTAAAARSRGLEVDVVPEKATLPATIDALEAFLRAI